MYSPAVSVLLPVYNCKAYIGAAINSILSQTLQDFELIILDDGSNDGTSQLLSTYTDPRIRHFHHANRGLAGTLNRGIELARGNLIARQDQDDISLPNRLQNQLAYMEAHPDCGLLGTWAQIIEVDHLSNRYHRHPTEPDRLRYELLVNNPFVHSSVMLRRSMVEAVGGYSTDPARQPPEDYELWSRLARCCDVANLPEVLLHYREIPGSMSRQGISPFLTRLVTISAENIAAAAGEDCGDPHVIAIAALTHGAPELISGRPNFRKMLHLLEAAINSFAAGELGHPMRLDAAQRIEALRAAWIIHRSPLYLMLQRQGLLRSLAKRIYSLRNRL